MNVNRRSKLVVGNWKMFKSFSQARNDFNLLNQRVVANKKTNIRFGVCSPSLYLSELAKQAQSIDLYAQNVHFENEGAFTGEISVPQLKSIAVSGSLVGHSERRQYFNESNESCGKKIRALLSNGCKVIYCVGETLEQRKAGHLETVLVNQIREAFAFTAGLSASDFIGSDPSSPLFAVAYEPVWAIGTGLSASVKDAEEAHKIIRRVCTDVLGQNFSENLKILYGGSVKASNIKSYLDNSEVDGALVGGASLNVEEFFDMSIAAII